MSTLPKGYLFGVKDNKIVIKDKLFVPCNRYHPDTARFVVLSESPCKENNFKSVSVMARYIAGQYHGVTTGDALPVILDHSVWTESSIAEGPYRIINDKNHQFYGDLLYEDFDSANNHVNNLNMGTFGTAGYTVVNEYGVPVDNNGHLYF